MMKITGRLGEYDCKWQQAGWTYAEVNVYKNVQKSFLGLGYISRVRVWQSSGKVPRKHYWAEKAKPEGIRHWFKEVVEEYESYKEAWDKELEEK